MTEYVFKVGRLYRGRYKLDRGEKLMDVPLRTPDKQVAEQRLRRIIIEEQRERDGLLAPKQQRETAQRPLLEHVKAFCQTRRAVKRDEKYVCELERKLEKLCADCAWQFVRDVTPESFEKWRARQRTAPKTLNEYQNAINGLMNWLEHRVGPNPLRFVQKVQTSGEPRRKRRALCAEQLRQLVTVSGERAVVYLVAAATGIRRGELGSLEWRDLSLDVPQPFIAVRSSIAKNHRHVMQPIPKFVADKLRALRVSSMLPNERVFANGIPRMEVYRRDLAAAGIDYKDAQGRFADFHALRTTFGTLLTLESRSQRTVMELMRHSDMKLTAKTYTDAGMLPVSETVNLLPDFSVLGTPSQIASQTAGFSSPGEASPVPSNAGEPKLLTAGEQTFSPSESASVRESLNEGENARCRVRTGDLSPRRPLKLEQRNTKLPGL
jgi:integrase